MTHICRHGHIHLSGEHVVSWWSCGELQCKNARMQLEHRREEKAVADGKRGHAISAAYTMEMEMRVMPEDLPWCRCIERSV